MVSPVAKRYGLAIFQLAEEKGFVEDLIRIFDEISPIFQADETKEFFKNPLIKFENKKKFLEELAEGMREELRNFFLLLLKKGRILFLPEIGEYVKFLNLQKKNIVPVEVVVAEEISEEMMKRIEEALSKITEAKVDLKVKVEPSILGGVLIKFEDLVINATLRRYLNEINQIIKKGEEVNHAVKSRRN